MVGHKSFSTKGLMVESLSDIETSILIELQSIANITFSKENAPGGTRNEEIGKGELKMGGNCCRTLY